MKLIEYKLPALILILIGILTVAGSFLYDIGSLRDMGPGYYPLLLGSVMIIIGGLLIFQKEKSSFSTAQNTSADSSSGASSRRKYAPLYLIAGLVAFIVLGRYGGLIPATFFLVLLGAISDKKNSPKDIILLAAGTSVVCGIVFNLLVDIQFPLFRWG